MNTKKSLGHFPFDSNIEDKSKLSFIPDINGDQGEDSSKIPAPFDVTDSDIKKREKNRLLEETSFEIIEREVPDAEDAAPVKKKVASYYMEESVINRLKAYCDAVESSYSAVTSEAIEVFVSKRGF